MTLKVLPPLVNEYTLEKSDAEYGTPGEKPTKVTFRQATKGDDIDRNRLFEEVVREYRALSDTVKVTSAITVDDVHVKEVYMTMASCDLLDEKDKPYFNFKDKKLEITEVEFAELFGLLPQTIADELIECSLKCNPQWTAQGKV